VAALRGSRVSGVMRAPIVDDVLSREGQMILSLLCVGHLCMAHPPLSGMLVRDVTQTHRVSGACCGVLRLSLSLSLSLDLWPFSSFLVSPSSFFNFLISSLLLLDCLFCLPSLFFLVFLFFQYLLADRLYALCHIRACSLISALLVICMGD
jgi:hypothetical protein